jgi:hypothetical protein
MTTPTTRELLELAAKAAGLRIRPNEEVRHDSGYMPDFQRLCPYRGWYRWEPLVDDGDAMRLRTALRLDIREGFGGRDDTITVMGHGSCVEVPVGTGTRDEAVRRAIVEAAAEVGRRMTPATGAPA